VARRVGQTVPVLYDGGGFGALYIFEPDGPFICRAICPERVGISRQEVAAKVRARQKQILSDFQKQAKKAARDAKLDDAVHDILIDRATASGKLAAFPTPTDPHQTTALSEAGRALRVDEAPARTTTADQEEQLQARAITAIHCAAQTTEADPAKARFARAQEIIQRLNAGEAVDEDDEFWLRGYRETPEFRGMSRLQAAFDGHQAIG